MNGLLADFELYTMRKVYKLVAWQLALTGTGKACQGAKTPSQDSIGVNLKKLPSCVFHSLARC